MKQLLIIAGLEANGFAGVLRDLQVCASVNIQPQAIVTTLTAQSTTQLLTAQPVDAFLIQQQLSSLTITPDVIKIGLIPNAEIADTIAAWLKNLSIKPIVILDPVLTSSGNGEAFFNKHNVARFTALLPFFALIAPNLDELKKIALNSSSDKTSDKNRTDSVLVNAFYKTHPTFNGGILLTGGHHPTNPNHQKVIDTLYTQFESEGNKAEESIKAATWQQSRLNINMRGTGCFLTTAIACAFTTGYDLKDAITLANAKMNEHFKNPDTTAAHWPINLAYYPYVKRPSEQQTDSKQTGLNSHNTNTAEFLPMHKPTGLYPVVDSSDWVERLASTGIHTIQLRIKNADPSLINQEIAQAVNIANKHNVQLFINDYWQLAIKHNAYGVHLGQEDLDTADLEQIHNSGLRLGISTHGDFELLRALQLQPSYLAIGAIFPTQTKDMTGKIQGLDRLARYCELINHIPIVAIGGINNSNLATVKAANPSMIAVVSAIAKAENSEQATAELVAMCSGEQTAALS